jgi:hypothetical protein
LTDVRRASGGGETAVVLCPRLPSATSLDTCLLVSVEGRYVEGETIATDSGGTTRLLVLERWSFSCVAAELTFLELMDGIKAGAAPLAMPEKPSLDAMAWTWAGSGAVLARHQLRGGGRSVAWYRGPCIAQRIEPGPKPDPWSVLSADSLYQFDATDGVFAVGYAAAGEIEGLIGLSSKAFTQAIVQTRRPAARRAQAEAQEVGSRALQAVRSRVQLASASDLDGAVPAARETARRLLALEPVTGSKRSWPAPSASAGRSPATACTKR